MKPSLTDAELIARAPGDPACFSELYRRHFDRVRVYTAARLGPDDGADALMDTFTAALRSLHRYDPEWDSALPWLLGIAERMVRRHRRREAVRLRTLAWLPVSRDQDRWGEVDERLAAPEALRAIGRAIGELPSPSVRCSCFG